MQVQTWCEQYAYQIVKESNQKLETCMYTHPKGGNYPEYNALLIEQNKLNQRTQNKTCGQI